MLGGGEGLNLAAIIVGKVNSPPQLLQTSMCQNKELKHFKCQIQMSPAIRAYTFKQQQNMAVALLSLTSISAQIWLPLGLNFSPP